MPTYLYTCEQCGEFEQWRSIHADKLLTHDCGSPVTQIIDRVPMHGIGVHGSKTREVDARESRWSKDMPAYKRLVNDGIQPAQIDGCDRLEHHAESRIEIESNGRLRISDSSYNEGKAMAEDIAAGRL